MGAADERHPDALGEPERAGQGTGVMGGPEGRTGLMGRGDGPTG